MQIKDDAKNGFYVENLTEEYVTSYEDVTQILIKVGIEILFYSFTLFYIILCIHCISDEFLAIFSGLLSLTSNCDAGAFK